MTYATVTALRAYLKEVARTGDQDDLLGVILDRASSVIDGVLGFQFAAYPAASAQIVYADPSGYVLLPVFDLFSVVSVTNYGTTLTDYIVKPVRKRGYLFSPYGWPLSALTVTAAWGYGPPPASVEEICLELAVNLWRSKDKGLFSDVIGVEGSGAISVGYNGALTNQQKMVLAGLKDGYSAVGV